MLFGFYGCRGFCHRTESDLFLFLLVIFNNRFKYCNSGVRSQNWTLKPEVNHTGWRTAVAPTDRPKSVRNRFVIESFYNGSVLV